MIAAVGPKPKDNKDPLLTRVADFVTKPEVLAVPVPNAETQRIRQVALDCALKALIRMGTPGVEKLTQFLKGTGLSDPERKALTDEIQTLKAQSSK